MFNVCKRHHKIFRKAKTKSILKHCHRSTLCHAAPPEISGAFVASEMYQNWFSKHVSSRRCENLTLDTGWTETKIRLKIQNRKSWEICFSNAFCKKECQAKRVKSDSHGHSHVTKTWGKRLDSTVILPKWRCTDASPVHVVASLVHHCYLRISCIFHVELYTGALQRLRCMPFVTKLSLLHLAPTFGKFGSRESRISLCRAASAII